MTGLEGIAGWAAASVVVLFVLVALRKPLGKLFHMTLRSCGALALLAVLQQLGPFLGITLGVNLINASILAVLGIPGFGLLLMLQWILH